MATKSHPQVQLTPVISAFDFREGAFFVAQRVRRVLLAVIGAGLTGLAAVAGIGLLAMLSTTASTAARTSTEAQQVVAAAALAKVDNAAGNSATALTAHVKRRTDAATSAVGSEVDVVTMIARIRASAPAGVVLTQILFKDPPPAATTASPTTPGAAAAKPTATSHTVEIHGTASSFSVIGPWSAAMQQVVGLSTVQPTWAGGEPVVQVTLIATLTDAARTKRAADPTGAKTGGH